MRTKSERRAQRERAKQRAKKMLTERGHFCEIKNVGRALGMRTKTRAFCSCPGCCNQRRNEWLSGEAKLSMQERKRKSDLTEINHLNSHDNLE